MIVLTAQKRLFFSIFCVWNCILLLYLVDGGYLWILSPMISGSCSDNADKSGSCVLPELSLQKCGNGVIVEYSELTSILPILGACIASMLSYLLPLITNNRIDKPRVIRVYGALLAYIDLSHQIANAIKPPVICYAEHGFKVPTLHWLKLIVTMLLITYMTVTFDPYKSGELTTIDTLVLQYMGCGILLSFLSSHLPLLLSISQWDKMAIDLSFITGSTSPILLAKVCSIVFAVSSITVMIYMAFTMVAQAYQSKFIAEVDVVMRSGNSYGPGPSIAQNNIYTVAFQKYGVSLYISLLFPLLLMIANSETTMWTFRWTLYMLLGPQATTSYTPAVDNWSAAMAATAATSSDYALGPVYKYMYYCIYQCLDGINYVESMDRNYLYMLFNFICFFSIHTVIVYTIDSQLLMLDPAKIALLAEQEANENRRAFLKYVFHEVRVPLSSISMGLNLMSLPAKGGAKEGGLADECIETIEMMSEATEFMTRTLNDVFSIQKIEDGKLELMMENCQVTSLLKRACASMKGQVYRKDMTLTIEVSQDVPEKVICDKVRLEHVIANFISNAVKFSRQGSEIRIVCKVLNNSYLLAKHPDLAKARQEEVGRDDLISRMTSFFIDIFGFWIDDSPAENKEEVVTTDTLSEKSTLSNYSYSTANSTRGARSGDYRVIHFSVFDEGVGVKKEDQNTLFNAYTQIRPGELQGGRGTGMGLAICREIIALHHGLIGIRSDPTVGPGSEFYFSIPVKMRKRPTGKLIQISYNKETDPAMVMNDRSGLSTRSSRSDFSDMEENSFSGSPGREEHNDEAKQAHGETSNLFKPFQDDLPADDHAFLSSRATITSNPNSGDSLMDMLADEERRQKDNEDNKSEASSGEEDTPLYISSLQRSTDLTGFKLLDDGIFMRKRTNSGSWLTIMRPASEPDFKAAESHNIRVRTPLTLDPSMGISNNNNNNNDNRKADDHDNHHDVNNNNGTSNSLDTSTREITPSLPSPSNPPGGNDPLRVLIVDDAAPNRKLLTILLNKHEGVFAQEAGGAEECWRLVQSEQEYHMIFLDNIMPQYDGLQCTRALREQYGYKNLIIGLSGNVMDDDLMNFLNAGADIAIAKPIKLKTVRELLGICRNFGHHSIVKDRVPTGRLMECQEEGRPYEVMAAHVKALRNISEVKW